MNNNMDSSDVNSQSTVAPRIKLVDSGDGLRNAVREYFNAIKYDTPSKTTEIEAKFGTGRRQAPGRDGFNVSPPITKLNYDEVIKKLRFEGFVAKATDGVYRLSFKHDQPQDRAGDRPWPDVRVEIWGVPAINYYCKTDSLDQTRQKYPSAVMFTQKTMMRDYSGKPLHVAFESSNFKVSCNTENTKPDRLDQMLGEWDRVRPKKWFRLINRVTYTHPKYFVKFDLSITKNANASADRLVDSGVFGQPERHELEIELDNARVMAGLVSEDVLLAQFKKCIKFVMSGIQSTNYPVSYVEQQAAFSEYANMIATAEGQGKKPVPFIGPSQYTLQMENVAQEEETDTDEGSGDSIVNIRKNFVVTEKADGERRLMLIAESGKIYFITTKRGVIFSGARTHTRSCFRTIVDGEYISHNKHGEFINLYMMFDAYYYGGESVRARTFIPKSAEKDAGKSKGKGETADTRSRYSTLQIIIKTLAAESVLGSGRPSPVQFNVKTFYPSTVDPNDSGDAIFQACQTLLDVKNKMVEYETDGLIFTHAYFGVSAIKEGVEGPLSNAPWEVSFKYKPPEMNTVDFKAVVVKTPTGAVDVGSRINDAGNSGDSERIYEFATLHLKCMFNSQRDGYVNPMQDVLSGNIPTNVVATAGRYAGGNSTEQRFYPTMPYDSDAGVTNIRLVRDAAGVAQMFTVDGDMFVDGAIVEFRYTPERESGWRWEPIRVRHDKVRSNAYTTANNNWKSINNPITHDMITTGRNIPRANISDDIYYNKSSGSGAAGRGRPQFKTDRMKHFHNLFVKHKLIVGASPRSRGTLIDYACGKAGDLPKWISAHLAFVLGIDISRDNLENRLDGSAARYLTSKKNKRYTPDALFAHGDSSRNIKNGDGLKTSAANQVISSVFGLSPKTDAVSAGNGVAAQYGVARDGFDVSSCQFAMHYMFKSVDTLRGFLRNLAECTKLGGHFIGTAYDGKKIFELLKPFPADRGDQIIEDGVKIWEVVKGYPAGGKFEDSVQSLGHEIHVFQESINQRITEYLVNFDYFDHMMELYGFSLVSNDDARDMSFSTGGGSFKFLYNRMMREIENSTDKAPFFGHAPDMTDNEKKISFLNRYVIYKKTRNVDLKLLEHTIERERERESEHESDSNKMDPVTGDDSADSGEYFKMTKLEGQSIVLIEDSKFIEKIKKSLAKKSAAADTAADTAAAIAPVPIAPASDPIGAVNVVDESENSENWVIVRSGSNNVATFSGSKHKLSNFYRGPHAVKVGGREYPTGEHAFQGEKYLAVSDAIADNADRAAKLRQHSIKFQMNNDFAELSEGELKRLGKSKTGMRLSADEMRGWDGPKSYQTQLDISKSKLEDPEISRFLQSTAPAILVHSALKTPFDKLPSLNWEGAAFKNKVSGEVRVFGKNNLGKIWMQYRDGA